MRAAGVYADINGAAFGVPRLSTTRPGPSRPVFRNAKCRSWPKATARQAAIAVAIEVIVLQNSFYTGAQKF